MTEFSSAERARGRRKVLLIAAIFFLPVAVSFALYYGGLWRPKDSSAKGELITPPRTLQFVGLHAVGGQPVDEEALKGKWSLIYIGNGGCDESCRTALTYGRQSWLALNQEMPRVQRVFMVTGDCCDLEYLAAEQPAIIVVDASSPQAAGLLAQFPGDRSHSLFIVDPLGNLMMRHDATRLVNKDLLTDLKKLLKLSHIG